METSPDLQMRQNLVENLIFDIVLTSVKVPFVASIISGLSKVGFTQDKVGNIYHIARLRVRKPFVTKGQI